MIDYWHLIRPRITALVLAAMGVSAWATADAPPEWQELFSAMFGAGLVIAGAIALNQRMECQGDAKMLRTASRPLPSGRLSSRQVTVFGISATVAGLAYLLVAVNATIAVLAAVAWFTYVAIYTPLKTRSPWQTPVGAAAGAAPVLLGAAVTAGGSRQLALVIFGIVYLWQLPHAMAIAWCYRREFAEAGVRVAPAIEPSGRLAGIWAVIGAAGLLPVCLMPCFAGSAGVGFGIVAALLAIGYLLASIRFAYRPTDSSARWLLRASLIYLPAMLVALLMA